MNNISKTDLELLKEKYPNNLDEILDKINNNYPVQYLIGNVNFYGYNILVDERALIPRYETEFLVDETIKLIKSSNLIPKIIEIGTGTGCISITLSNELNTNVHTVDISKDAIELAKENAKLNNSNITFQVGDIRNCKIDNKYNILISNPPYISYDIEVGESIKYEPQNAIFAKDNGLELYKVILKRSKEFLNEKNIIAFEIGYEQKDSITSLAKDTYPNAKIICKKDLANKDRYIFIINE